MKVFDTRCEARLVDERRRCRGRAVEIVRGRGLCGLHAGMSRTVGVAIDEPQCRRCGIRCAVCAARDVTA